MLKDYEFNVLSAIVNYYLSLCNRKIKIVSNTDDEINILFNKRDFAELTRLNKYYKHDNGGKCNELKFIFERILNGEEINISKEEEQRINNVCFNFHKIFDMNLNTIHSIIDYNGKKYIIVKGRYGIVTMELEEKSRKDGMYYVINRFVSENQVEKIINKKNAYISIPKSFDTIDLGCEDVSFANNTGITYTERRNNYDFKHQVLKDDLINLRLLEIRELLHSNNKKRRKYKDFLNTCKVVKVAS